MNHYFFQQLVETKVELNGLQILDIHLCAVQKYLARSVSLPSGGKKKVCWKKGQSIW